MKLQEIFDQLTYGEFAQLSIGGQEPGVVNESNWARVLSHVNLGLSALYKRFSLKEGRIELLLQPEMTVYKINSTFAVNNRKSRSPLRYLNDTADTPFVDDIQKIEKVLTDSGYELGLNNASDELGVTTPTALSLRVPQLIVDGSPDLPDYLNTGTLKLIYRAAHPKIEIGIGYFDPARVEVELPDTHLEPLLNFVASRVQAPIGMQNEFNASNNYYAKYEAACQALELQGLEIDQGSQSFRLFRNGWV